MKRLLIFGLASLLCCHAHAGQLYNADGFQNKYVPDGVGFTEIATFKNTTGAPIYIVRYRVFVLVGDPGGVCIGIITTMPSTASRFPATPVYYWQRFAEDGWTQGFGNLDANQKCEDVRPDYFTLDPGDELCMLALSSTPNHVQSFVSAWVWYVTSP